MNRTEMPKMKLRTVLLAALFALSMLPCIASAQAQASPSPGEKPPVHQKSLLIQIEEGGWVMIPIAICSVLTFYLIVDGVLRTMPRKVLPPEHLEALKTLFPPGDYVGAYDYCKAHPSPFTNVCRIALSLLGEGKAAVEEGILSELSREDSKMQTYISYLSVIGVCTPMIGLLGTVTGMIKAFATLGASGIGDPSSLSAAIGEVLVATASGLVIAIPAFGAFYFLRNRAVRAVHDVQDIINSLFRKMPYETLAGVHLGDEELYAATPNWVVQEEFTTATPGEAV